MSARFHRYTLLWLFATGCTQGPQVTPTPTPTAWTSPATPACDLRRVEGSATSAALSLYPSMTCSVTTTGQLWCWGQGWETAETLQTTGRARHTPHHLEELGEDVVQFVHDGHRSFTLHGDGTVRSWAAGEAPRVSFAEPGLVEIRTLGRGLVGRTAQRVIVWGVDAIDRETLDAIPPPIHGLVDVDITEPSPKSLGPSPRRSPHFAVIAGPTGALHVIPDSEELDNMPPLTGLSAVVVDAADLEAGCALLEGGVLTCWDHDGVLGLLRVETPFDRRVVQLTAAFGEPCVVFEDGGLSCRGSYCAVPEFDDVAVLGGGSQHACFGRSDKGVWCWGNAGLGKLGWRD